MDLTDPLAEAPLSPEQRRVWNTLRHELTEARVKLRDLEKKLHNLEQHPPEEQAAILTRPEFNREVARMLAFDERYGGTSSILYFDFDKLDGVAARYGKSVANAAVREITTVLMSQVRGSDIVGRLAPDEFGVLLVRCSNADAWNKGKSLAAALFAALAEVHGCKLDLAINYGAYTFRENEDIGTGLKEAAKIVTKATQ